MTCTFSVSHDGTTHELAAERIAVNDEFETWRVHGRGEVNRSVTITNNRPALHRNNSYKAYYKWTTMEGDPHYRRIVGLITSYLEYYIKGLWKPPTKGVNEAKAAAAKAQGKLF